MRSYQVELAHPVMRKGYDRQGTKEMVQSGSCLVGVATIMFSWSWLLIIWLLIIWLFKKSWSWLRTRTVKLISMVSGLVVNHHEREG